MTNQEFRDSVIRYRMFKVVRVAPTETKPRRIRITDTRHSNSITFSSDKDRHVAAATYLENLGIFVKAMGMGWDVADGGGTDDCVLLSENFHTKLTKPHA